MRKEKLRKRLYKVVRYNILHNVPIAVLDRIKRAVNDEMEQVLLSYILGSEYGDRPYIKSSKKIKPGKIEIRIKIKDKWELPTGEILEKLIQELIQEKMEGAQFDE